MTDGKNLIGTQEEVYDRAYDVGKNKDHTRGIIHPDQLAQFRDYLAGRQETNAQTNEQNKRRLYSGGGNAHLDEMFSRGLKEESAAALNQFYQHFPQLKPQENPK